MIAELLSINCELVLPLISNNRSEAEALLAATILGQQLDACVRCLISSIEHEKNLMSLYDASVSSRNAYDIALIPILLGAVTLSKQRIPIQMDALMRLIEHLCRLESTIRQFGMQNLTLAQELAGHAVDVAEQKRALSQVELDLCSRISAIIGLADDNSTPKFEVIEALLRKAETLQKSSIASTGPEMTMAAAPNAAASTSPHMQVQATASIWQIQQPKKVLEEGRKSPGPAGSSQTGDCQRENSQNSSQQLLD